MQTLPKVRFNVFRQTFVKVFAVVLIFTAGYAFGIKGFYAQLTKFPVVKISRENPPDHKELDFSLFWKVWDTLNKEYYDQGKLIPANMVYGAIKGMVSAVGDPYTLFLAPSENKVIEEDLQGTFEGVGIQIGYKGTQLVVIAPLPESPADKAGVKPGDFILEIKDEQKKLDVSTNGLSLEEAVSDIRGKKGTKVTLTLLREGQTDSFTVDLVRESINVPSVTLTYLGDNKKIADLKVLKFAAETKTEWSSKVIEIQKNPEITSVIVDLRNNPGGYLDGAVDLASDFLDSGQVAVIEDYGSGKKDELKTTTLPRLKNYKTVVLINKGSASASEILAGALRDQSKIQLVGETSFGKGTIQEPLDLENGSGLHITIAKWLTPSGFWVNEKGLEPDVKVTDDPKTPEDEQLQKAQDLVKP